MTMSASLQRAIAPRRISPREARAAVTEANERLQAALAAMAKADADEASAKAHDAAVDRDAAAVLRKSEQRKNQNTRDHDRAWLATMAKRLRQLSYDCGEPNVAELRIASRMRELAEEAERVLRSLS
jgi:hypothetical protein